MLFDSHAHLDAKQFDADRDLVVARAKLNAVSYIFNPGADFGSSQAAIRLAEMYDFIYAGVGVHPHDAKTMDEEMLNNLAQMAKHSKVKAIGEIGLDYHYDFSPRDIQRKWFTAQIRLAKQMNLPMVIHDREAHADVLECLIAEKAFDVGVLMHCFSGSVELAKQYVKLGATLSIAGPVTYKNARKTIEVVENIPIEHLLIETDAPYLTPEPFRGKRNESMYVKYTCDRVAQIKKMEWERVAEITLNNGKAFFKIE